MATDVLSGIDRSARARLESLLVRFDLNWGPDELAAAVAGLPADEPLRRAALVELVKIDLERQWRAGRSALVEDYIRRYPALGPDATALVRAEIEARGQAGAATPRDEFHRRFPDLFSSAGAPTLPAPNATEARPALPAPSLPERFGRYHILRPLGRGGMGAVYLARDSELERLVALKVPNLETGDPEAVERFAREAKAAATIEHPNICRVYDVGRIDGRQYLTMAFVDGRTLADAMRDEPPASRQAVELVRTVARAVAEAHSRGVVHRDLKPGNILLTAAGEPVVTDFGLARRESATDPRLTETGAALGTPLYMSPEQMTGDTARIGPASDVYSLGVVLYELLAGRPPFGTARSTLFTSTLTETPPGPSRVRPGVDPGLDDIVLTALGKTPEDRYPTMAAFADALDDWLVGRQRKAGRWWPLVLLAGLAVVLMAVPIACDLGWPGKRTSSVTRPPAIGPGEQGDPKASPAEPKLVGSGAVPGDGERLVAIAFGPDPDTLFTASFFDGAQLKLRRWDVAAGKVQAEKHDLDLYDWAAFASDGHRVFTGGFGELAYLHTTADFKTVQRFKTSPHQHTGALARNNRRAVVGLEPLEGGSFRVRVFDTGSGASLGDYVGHPDNIRVVALSDDGTLAASASPNHFAVREVGQNKLLIQAGGNSIRSLVFLPNSGRLAAGTEQGDISLYDVATKGRVREFDPGHPTAVDHLAVSATGVLLSGGADGTVRVWDVETGRERFRAFTGKGPVACVAVSPDGKRIAAGWMDRTWRVWDLP
jgi:predicted Ser/Thr protein kinase